MKTLVLYYSSYGHVETLAHAIADGAKQVKGNEVVVKRMPETLPEDVQKKMHMKSDRRDPVATIAELADYDCLIVGTPTRFGRLPAQTAAFWDQGGGLWEKGSLVGKVASVFTSTATQHGGNELTNMAMITNLLHFGCVIVGLPYTAKGQMTLDEITGGSPYGLSTIAGGQGQRQPSDNELEMARFHGKHTAEIALKVAQR